MKISKVLAYQVLDSRGRPTVAASVTLTDGSTHTARVPSGASTGKHEAYELRDEDSDVANPFYRGKSVNFAVKNVNEKIGPAITGMVVDLAAIDQMIEDLDTSVGRSDMGANATLAVSLAVAKAAAHSQNHSLARYFQPEGPLLIPMPMVNILSGGAHAKRSMDIQDILVVPVGAQNFTEALSWVSAIRETAAALGAESGQITHLVADEGGLGMHFPSIEAACEFVLSSIADVGLHVGEDVSLALDVAATQFFDGSRYQLQASNQSYSPKEFVGYILGLVNNLPIISIEDPFGEDDWQSWQRFLSIAPSSLQILGDDLLTTNSQRLARAISEEAANAILIKVNQNGLISSTRKVLSQAQNAGFRTVVSARSGETEDAWLADLAVGWRAGQIKVGSTHGSERNAKWNRLLELEATEITEFAHPFNG